MTPFAFVPLDALSPKAEQIYQKAQEIYSSVDPKTHPGLSAQYAILTERLAVNGERNGVGCEFIVFAGMLSRPSTFGPTA